MSSKFRRCMWYNEVGWPRVNPTLEKKGVRPPVGCVRDANVCVFAHPSDPEWETASNSDVPKKLYGGRPRPETPVPPELRRKKDEFRRDRTPERSFRVKEEQLSPKLSFGPESEPGRGVGRAADARSIPHTPLRNASPPPNMFPNDRPRRDSRSYDRRDDRQGGSSRGPASGESSGYRLREPPKIASSSRSERRDDSVLGQESSQTLRTGDSLLARMQMGDMQARDAEYRGRARSPPRPGWTPTRASFREPSRSDRGYDQYRERARERDDPHAHEQPYDTRPNSRRSPPRKTSATPRPLTPPNQTSSSMAPPSEPPNGSTIPPPPQPPSFAQSLTDSQRPNNAPRDIPPEKRRELWNERIILLSDAVSARTGQQQALADLARIQNLNDSARNNYISVDAQKAMAHAMDLAKAKLEEEKKRHTSVVQKLFASDFWPIRVKREGGQVDEDSLLDMDSKIDEMKSQVMSLAEDVLRNDRMLREVVEWIGSRAISTTTVLDVVDTMENDRGLKRRRLNSDAILDQPAVYETTSTSSSMTLVPTPTPEQLPTPVTTAEFKTEADNGNDDISTAMQRIITLSNRLRNLEHSVQNATEESDERIKEYVDVELEEIKKKFVNKKGEHYTRRMLELKEEIESCGKDISDLSEELAALISGNVERNKEVNELREEIRERRTTIVQLETDLVKERAELSELRAACKQTTEEIRALSAAFKLQIAKTKELAPPMLPSLEDLAALLEPKVKESVRGEVMQMMSSLRTEIVQLVRDQAVPLNSTFQEKLTKLTRLPDILAFLSSNMNNGDAAAADLPGPSNPSRPP